MHPLRHRFGWVVMLGLGLGGNARSDDWPQWLGPQRNAIAAERGADRLLPEPQRVWTNAVGLGCSSVVVSRGRAFTLGHAKGEGKRGTDTVFALDAITGRILWRQAYDCLTCFSQDVLFDGPRSTPTVDGDRVYTLSLEGHLFLRNNAGAVACYQLLRD
jgi:hypothetical protein